MRILITLLKLLDIMYKNTNFMRYILFLIFFFVFLPANYSATALDNAKIKVANKRTWERDPFFDPSGQIKKAREMAKLKRSTPKKKVVNIPAPIVKTEKQLEIKVAKKKTNRRKRSKKPKLLGIWKSKGQYKAFFKNRLVAKGESIKGFLVKEVLINKVVLISEYGEVIVLEVKK
jgi:hypothetical protein